MNFCTGIFLRRLKFALANKIASMGITEKAFVQGSSFPEPTDPSKIRVYGMRFCPFTERTRLVLNHLKVPYEVVNINLKHKPDWFLARNPLGQIPVIEQADKILYDSGVCNEYLNDSYRSKLFPSDPYLKARLKLKMEAFGKVHEKVMGIMLHRIDTAEGRKVASEELIKVLKTYEESLTGTFFGGDEPNMLDYHMWPWFERMPTMEKSGNVKVLSEAELPKLVGWIKTMQATPPVQAATLSDELHYTFIQPYLNGSEDIDYDVGL